MRKLASIRTIENISPIDGADSIDVATIGGWSVVVKKNEFNVGDKVVYFEIDSWVPHKIAPFLTKNREPAVYNGVPGERLRSVKLRGQISQGLVIPIPDNIKEREEGFDLTDILGVQKWEPPISACLAGTVKGVFPFFIPKTDQERIQNLTQELPHWIGSSFEVTEKLDGTSATFFIDLDGSDSVCSRNLNLKETDNNVYWMVARNLRIHDIIKKCGVNVAIQGEIIGPKIQNNYYGIANYRFFVFDIFNIDKSQYLIPEERRAFCQEHGLDHVPVVDSHFTLSNSHDAQKILQMADGGSKLVNKSREGLVFKGNSVINGNIISFKAISNKWLLKNQD